MRTLVAALMALLAVGATPRTALAEEADRLRESVFLDVVDAKPSAVFASLAERLQAKLELDPEVSATIDIRLQGVRLQTALAAICDTIGCRWSLRPGDPLRLVIAPAPIEPRGAPEPRPTAALDRARAGLEETFTIELRAARAADVLGSFAHVLRVRLAIDPALLDAEVTLDLEERPVREALDAVCAQIHCDWMLADDGGPSLRLALREPAP